MRLVAMFALLLGLALAGTAVYFVAERFKTMQAQIAAHRALPNVEMVQVAIAIKELRYGDVLTPDAVAMAAWPKPALPKNAFLTVESLFGPANTAPRSVLRIIEPGEPILPSKVTKFGEPAGIAQRLAPGKRAFTVRVDVASGVSGFLTTGDSVDVFWSGNDSGRALTRLILENVPLIAIDQQADEEPGRAVVARTVTVEVAPPEVALLAQATASGRLSLSLRGVRDDSAAGVVEVDQRRLTGRETVVVQEDKPIPTIRVRRGAEVTDEPTGGVPLTR